MAATLRRQITRTQQQEEELWSGQSQPRGHRLSDLGERTGPPIAIIAVRLGDWTTQHAGSADGLVAQAALALGVVVEDERDGLVARRTTAGIQVHHQEGQLHRLHSFHLAMLLLGRAAASVRCAAVQDGAMGQEFPGVIGLQLLEALDARLWKAAGSLPPHELLVARGPSRCRVGRPARRRHDTTQGSAQDHHRQREMAHRLAALFKPPHDGPAITHMENATRDAPGSPKPAKNKQHQS